MRAGRADSRRARAGFALLRLMVAGICNTDLELQRGYYGFAGTPGHEFVAEVVEADDRVAGRQARGGRNQPGLRATATGAASGLGRHCPGRTVLGIVGHPGAFAEFFTLPERNLHVLPDGLPAERAVFTEPLAAACEILDQVAIPPCAPVAVLGDGKLGLLIAQVLNAYGYRVHQFGRHNDKLRIAGALRRPPQLPPAPSPVAEYDWVVEATGSPEGLRAAAAMVAPARHADSEIHRAWNRRRRYRAHHRQRDHPGRLALRPLRSGPAAARSRSDSRGGDGRRPFPLSERRRHSREPPNAAC